MALNVGDIIWRACSDCGLEFVFGLPGTQNIPLLEALRKSKLRFVTAGHELSAAFMAVGYYRVHSKPALVTTIPGPGFTYALSGIAEAREDSCALIYLLVVPPNHARKAHFLHDLRHEEIIQALVKKSFRIERSSEAAQVISDAYDASLKNEPGPVFVGISADLIEKPVLRFDGFTRTSAAEDDRTELKNSARRCAQALLGSTRPLLFIGMGAGKSSALLQELSLQHRIPVFATLSGRGIIPADHKMYLPVDFSFGTPRVFRRFLRQIDCMLALGCKFSHNGTGGYSMVLPKKKLINVNSCRASLNANYSAHLAVNARVEDFLHLFHEALGEYRTAWREEKLQQLRHQLEREALGRARIFPLILKQPAHEFFLALRQALSREAILFTDTGLHQVMARQFFPVFYPAGLIAPSDFQSMGFALPAAIGAAVGESQRPVICLLGDGGFNVSALEMLTAVRENLNLLIIVFRDGCFGQIRQTQVARYGLPFGVEFPTPDYRAMASALNISYVKLKSPMTQCLQHCLQTEGLKLMEVSLENCPQSAQLNLVSSAKARVRPLLGATNIRILKKIIQR